MSTSEGLVVFSSNSWISDFGMYNRFTGTFTPNDGVTMTAEEQEAYVKETKSLVSCKLQMTTAIIENNYYKLLFQ